ncbi:oocyte zinc finger -like [Pelobates cultripes]|uniref:Oocyte zinc finger -like n=1 Tax=Pelobates cultripes TaxID=61616 RepID=A0AAD1T7H5_PELCU|nr:oocyte zinc finger -like [Pelobates cultripes]
MMPNTNWNQMTERFLDLTLEVNYLLTGESYIVVKKPAESILQSNSPCVPDGLNRTQSPSRVPPRHSLIHERNNDQKVLELTNQIIHLLTGEVWKYLEGHKEPYNDLMMDTHQPLSSLANGSLNTSETDDLPIHVLSANCVTEGRVADDQGGNSMTFNELSKRPSESVKSETALYEERNLPDGDIYSLKECSQTKSPSTSNVEESASREDIHFTDTDIITPTEQTPYPSTPIKEEPTQCREDNLTDTDINTPTVQTEYPSSHIKEDPASWEERNLTASEIIPTVQTEYPSTRIKEESDTCEEGTLIDRQMYKPPKDSQTEYPSNHLRESFALWVEGNLTDTEIYASIEHTEKEPLAYIKERSVLWDEGHFNKMQNKANGKIFEGPMSEFAEYQRNHEENTSSECETEVSSKEGFIRHPFFHQKSPSMSPQPTAHGEKTLSLFEHDKSFLKRKYISKHQHVPSREKYFSCPECGKLFYDMSMVKLHLLGHIGEKPFSCTECDKSFSQSSDLQKHLMIHTGEKPFSCSECGKCFSRKGNLNSHLRIHTGEKPYFCDLCGKSFTRNSYLKLHQKNHTDKEPVF